MIYARRQDGNHAEIKAVFVRMLGDRVTDISGAGMGLGDLVASYGPYPMFIEIKRDAKAKLTVAENVFAATHRGCVMRVENIAQAENAARIIRARGMMLADRIDRKAAA
jgi:hypothetical protein